MILTENKVYHLDNLEGMKFIPSKSANLIISDPPYFRVKGAFDFVFKGFDEYLAFMDAQAKEYKRILADNGTLFVYGHAKRIAYIQVIFDKYFNLENNLVWRKKDSQTMKCSYVISRCFTPITERILMYSNEVVMTGLEAIFSNPDCFKSIKQYMREERDKLIAAKEFKTLAQFNDFINGITNTTSVVSRHYFSDSQYIFPTENIYRRMQETGFWQKEYETLRREYETLRRPFNQSFLQYDVLDFSQETHIARHYDHDTIKPEGLTRMLIKTCSHPNDLVVVPFSGSGTECAMALCEGRRFIGFDVEKKYVDMGNNRCNTLAAQPKMF